jgi:hypothetical protein
VSDAVFLGSASAAVDALIEIKEFDGRRPPLQKKWRRGTDSVLLLRGGARIPYDLAVVSLPSKLFHSLN